MKYCILLLLCASLYAKSIITLTPAVNEIAFALNANVIATVNEAVYPQNNLPKIGTYTDASVEKIISLKPDAVIGESINSKTIYRLQSLKINTLTVKTLSLNDILNSINAIGIAANRQDAALTLAFQVQSKYNELAKLKRLNKKILIVYGVKSIKSAYVASGDEFVSQIAVQCGFINSAPKGLMSYEGIIKYNPDVVVILAPNEQNTLDIKNMYSNLPIKAAKSSNIYVFNGDYCLMPSNRVIYLMQDFEKLNDRMQ